MNFYNTLSVLIAAVIYVYLFREIRKGTAEQNMATWVSWGLLDSVTGVSLYVQHGNWYLLAIYVFGCVLVVSAIVRSAKFTWGMVEKVCFFLVIVSVVIWTQSGPRDATIISTVGVAIATYPQIKDAFFTPKMVPMPVYLGFTFVNVLATVGGKSWSIEERFYPAVCTVLCLFIVGFTARKYFVLEKPQGA